MTKELFNIVIQIFTRLTRSTEKDLETVLSDKKSNSRTCEEGCQMPFKLPDPAPRVTGNCTATSKNVKPSKQRKMNPIKFCFFLSVMFGATSFLVIVEASQVSQGKQS